MSELPCPRRRPTMAVIGYGNELRGDDGVGIEVARAVATWELADVRAYAAHQLTPELAAELAGVDWVVFVDACGAIKGDELEVRPVRPLANPALDPHLSDPSALLTLTRALYGRSPRAWQLLIPASSFAYGQALSSETCRGKLVALRFLRDLIHSFRAPRAGIG